tara:strand:- start:262 stop:465 length:204 start_codon:yes stop_codon:yes gene_type:complete
MEEIFADTEKQLLKQQEELAEYIKTGEAELIRNKELYLKVTGALEGVTIVRERIDKLEQATATISEN